MLSSIIGKIEKAKRYAKEPERVTFQSFTLKFHGDHSDYNVSFKDGKWHCNCNFFSGWGICSHTMTLQRMVGNMLPKEAMQNINQYSLLPMGNRESQLTLDVDSGLSVSPQIP